ncbi:hypothetical protein EV644_12428 [Kribbella orskensis]|uniref:Uncharacterized protein n=1 Tax=Kribbella orskensis TaxID=2512216 RepID=A0ABY2BAC7_9ACTN|nr:MULTISPECIES: hypothetical protein [Kribbella]TCN32778.1 hypothetical protein EV642_12670 [Kribbella sp. VKM Ac-2500]TCO12904.1 hypothetical protein EV644_12428 [Kribbella orskensis]
MTTTPEHPYALRAPWYVLARDNPPSFAPKAKAPAIQKYVTDDFVTRLLEDPRDSIKFDRKDDVWSYPVPIALFPNGVAGRKRFATHRMVHTPMRKLYQPSHDRYYALTIELFCDEPGLPLPGEIDDVDVRFVIRRERVDVPAKAAEKHKADIMKLATKVLLAYDEGKPPPADPLTDDDVDGALWTSPAVRNGHEVEYQALLKTLGATQLVEAWTIDASGRGAWQAVPGNLPTLLDGEQELPMWRVPPRAEDCARAQLRSVWFGLVPTFSGDVDRAGRAKVDDRSVYRMTCFVRRRPEPGREHCPPHVWWSKPTEPYRLASFFDPSGTKNRHITVTAPDFRTLAARAGERQGPGGLEFVRPPGSQLSFNPNNGSPKEADGNRGTATKSCTVALELLMIVAMFVFSLFLPIVTFLFQLWWMLLLKFCWPPNETALKIVNDHLNGPPAGTIKSMPPPERAAMDELLGAKGAADGLADVTDLGTTTAIAKTLVASLEPPVPPTLRVPVHETQPDDPLCDPRL